MRDDSDTSPAENDRGPGIGERLTRARESRGLTIDAAAQDLHVDPSVLRALENEDFDAIVACQHFAIHDRLIPELLAKGKPIFKNA